MDNKQTLIEEKAKAYDEALEKAKYYVDSYENQSNPLTEAAMEAAKDIFPELAESEDERIIKIIRRQMCHDAPTPTDEERVMVNAWLEKQKDPKDPFDNEMFMIGYCNGKHDGYQEGYKAGMESTSYHFPVMPTTPSGFSCDGVHCTNPNYDCINCPRKDSSAGRISIVGNGSITLSTNDDNPSGLKATNKSLDEINKEKSAEKPDLVAELKHYLATTPKEQLQKDWDDLKEWGNIGPTVQEFLYGKPSEWSNEDMDMIGSIRSTIELDIQRDANCPDIVNMHKKELEWFDSLYDRGLQVEQKPAEWSNEDEKTRNSIIEAIRNLWPYEHRDKCIQWLKSLKNRGNSLKSNTNSPSWKPSKEQMEAFSQIVQQFKPDKELESLYNGLKKL